MSEERIKELHQLLREYQQTPASYAQNIQNEIALIVMQAMDAQRVETEDLIKLTGLTLYQVRRVINGDAAQLDSMAKVLCALKVRVKITGENDITSATTEVSK